MKMRPLSLSFALLFLNDPVLARKIFTAFDYNFDVVGQTHGFSHNDPTSGDAKWHPGGALGSTGCLKVTGPVATFERFDWFKAGVSTISFHYYAHGYTLLQTRLNVAFDEHKTRYGRYGRHYLKPAQDKWQFAQIPIAGVPGDAKGKPKSFPELVMKSLTFIADGGGAQSYLLIDNIRLGASIREDQVVVRELRGRSFGKRNVTLLDFEKPGEEKLVLPSEFLKTSISDRWAASGKKSLKLTCAKGRPWTPFEFDRSLLKGWEDYDYLSIDFYSEDPAIVRFTPEFWDRASHNYHTRSTFEGQAGMKVVPVHQGKTRVLVHLKVARRNGKEGLGFGELQKEDKIDFGALKKVTAWFNTSGLKEDYVVYLDNVRLLQEGALESNMRVDLPKGTIAFDFGENSPLVQGFTEASVTDVWSEKGSFGFVKPEGLVADGRDWPDPLTGDYVSGGHRGDEMVYRPASFEFRAKVPNGKYLAWLAGGYFPYPDLSVTLDANGETLFSGELAGKLFYSRRWYFRFFDVLYSEKPNALWNDVVSKIHPGHVFDTEVTNGVFAIRGSNSFLSAFVLLPVDRRTEFDALTRRIEEERIRYFYRDLYLQRPKNESCSRVAPNFLLFAPPLGRRIMPWSGVGRADARQLRKVATPGEAFSFQVAVRPFSDSSELKLSFSGLSGPGGIRLSSSLAQIFLKKYLSNGQHVVPWCLVPRTSVPLEKGLTRSFWIRFRIPDDTAPGLYRGKILAQANGTSKELPIEVRVFPFRLAKDHDLSVGLYYRPPDGGQFALLDRVNDFQAERDRILKEQMELLAEYGMTSVELPVPGLSGLRGGGALLNFSGTEKVAAAAKAGGLLRTSRQRAFSYTLSFGRAIGRRLAGSHFKEGTELRHSGFDSAYFSANRQFVEWGEKTNTPLVFWVVDEPRETPNPWNRNLADTISYLKLAGKVKGAVRMITPMGDSNGGKDYLPILDHLEIVATHSTKSSRRFITGAMTNPEVELWIYNAGKDRYSNGFYLWRVGATGKHEWHFNQWKHAKTRNRYLGSEIHNPFLNYEHTAATVPAPLEYKGALLPKVGLLTMSNGINDYLYVHALEQSIKSAKRKGRKIARATEAERYLSALRNVIPIFPNVKNLATEADLALVGEGIEGGGVERLDTWREKIAEFVVSLRE
ncbi:MAG: glycoside hydrolase domain-containing protein [Opitutales bacterium]